MRLAILDRGHGLGTKILFAIIRAVSRHPVLDVIKLVRYRPDFYRAGPVTHDEALSRRCNHILRLAAGLLVSGEAEGVRTGSEEA